MDELRHISTHCPGTSRKGQQGTCATESVARAACIALDRSDIALVPCEALFQQRPHLLQRVRYGLWILHKPETGITGLGLMLNASH